MAQFNFPRSKVIAGLEWLGERISYPESAIKGDDYPMTWADDDEIYTSAGDPEWGDAPDGLDVEKFSGGPKDYKISKVHAMPDYRGCGGDGPKPTGMICVDGVLYLAFQNMLRLKASPHGGISQHGSDGQIVYSVTKGASWVPALQNVKGTLLGIDLLKHRVLLSSNEGANDD